MGIERGPYSYRSDPSVADFPDDRPIIIFDGYCNLCTGWVHFILRHDSQAKFKLLAAQTTFGHSLYRHYGLDPGDYETNILLADGVAWFKAEGTIRMFQGLGRTWSAVRMFRILSRTVSRMIYECIAANRFRIFGKRESCFVEETEMKARFLA